MAFLFNGETERCITYYQREIALVGDKLNTRTLLVVLVCLKDRAFHIRTVYVSSLDANGIVWRRGNLQFHNASTQQSAKKWTEHPNGGVGRC